MTPTLPGRIQTRIFALAVVGGLWTLVVSPFLPGMGALGDVYEATFAVLAVVLILGVGWELVYHGLQQFRWEKDWPTLFGLLTGINEGLLTWVAVEAGWIIAAEVPVDAYAIHFSTTWLAVFLFVNGPIRVPFPRWRYRGGRIV